MGPLLASNEPITDQDNVADLDCDDDVIAGVVADNKYILNMQAPHSGG